MIFVNTFRLRLCIIITVNPPIHYIVFCYTPYETKNTFSKEKAAVRIGCLFSCLKNGLLTGSGKIHLLHQGRDFSKIRNLC